MSVVIEPTQSGVVSGGIGTFGWPGAFGGWWQADPRQQMILLWLQQCTADAPRADAPMPRLPGMHGKIAFREAVYKTLSAAGVT
jgi:CubicO group peptidase (beta-lactamase class C family)